MLDNFVATLQTLSQRKRLWVGFSGGVDSHVLLDLCIKAFKNTPDYHIGAIHVHHGISEYADQWVEHCEAICAELQVPLTVLWVDAKECNGESPEEVAREARYAAFAEFLTEQDCLLLAHHAADQAETILLRLFRGTGPLGLGGIPASASLGKGEMIRPLLQTPKEDILEYAKAADLKWIEDDSNSNNRFDRNFLRQEIMPVISARWPRVVRSVNRAGALCLETVTAVQVLALQDLATVQGHDPAKLSVSKVLQLDPVRRRSVLRCWLQNLGVALPSRDHMDRIDREVLQAKPGSKPRLKISSYEIVRLKDELSLNLIVS